MKELKTWWEKSSTENKAYGSYTEDKVALYIGGKLYWNVDKKNKIRRKKITSERFSSSVLFFVYTWNVCVLFINMMEYVNKLLNYLKTIAICSIVSD